jgi:hypothetical protein
MAHNSALPSFKITSPELPGVLFFSLDTFADDAAHACAERDAFDAFDEDGIEDALQLALQDMGWRYDEIRDYLDASVNERKQMLKIGYFDTVGAALLAA